MKRVRQTNNMTKLQGKVKTITATQTVKKNLGDFSNLEFQLTLTVECDESENPKDLVQTTNLAIKQELMKLLDEKLEWQERMKIPEKLRH